MIALLLCLACVDKSAQDSAAPKDTGADTAPADSAETAETAETDETDEPEDTAVDFCDGAPTVTYESFGRGFLTGNCQGCHASTAADRYDAPEEVTFDTVEQAWAWAEDILEVATGDEPAMPPQGGVAEDDRTRLEWWLRCADPGT